MEWLSVRTSISRSRYWLSIQDIHFKSLMTVAASTFVSQVPDLGIMVYPKLLLVAVWTHHPTALCAEPWCDSQLLVHHRTAMPLNSPTLSIFRVFTAVGGPNQQLGVWKCIVSMDEENPNESYLSVLTSLGYGGSSAAHRRKEIVTQVNPRR